MNVSLTVLDSYLLRLCNYVFSSWHDFTSFNFS